MLTDPQSITVGAATIPLPRTAMDRASADYTSSDSNSQMRVTQSTTSSQRNTSISLKTNKIAADPISAVNSRKSQLVTITFRGPIDGFTITELKDQFAGLAALLNASSAATLIKILGGEK